ncbi:MAG: NAD(P)-binding protein, partial [Bacilli bacterium]
MNKDVDVLVIGAGQAGLAMGYYLKKPKRSFVLIDAESRIGDVWRNRYESLVLFSPRVYSSLPGMALPGDPEGFPTKNEFADYLETYANYFSLLRCYEGLRSMLPVNTG